MCDGEPLKASEKDIRPGDTVRNTAGGVYKVASVHAAGGKRPGKSARLHSPFVEYVNDGGFDYLSYVTLVSRPTCDRPPSPGVFKVGDVVTPPPAERVILAIVSGRAVLGAAPGVERLPAAGPWAGRWSHPLDRLTLVRAAPPRWRVCTRKGLRLGDFEGETEQDALIAYLKAEGHEDVQPSDSPDFVNMPHPVPGGARVSVPLALYKIEPI